MPPYQHMSYTDNPPRCQANQSCVLKHATQAQEITEGWGITSLFHIFFRPIFPIISIVLPSLRIRH